MLYKLDWNISANLPSWKASGIKAFPVDIFPMVKPLEVPAPVLDKIPLDWEVEVEIPLLLFSNLKLVEPDTSNWELIEPNPNNWTSAEDDTVVEPAATES